MEEYKAATVAELFDMIKGENIERLMFDLYKTAHCFVELKESKPEYSNLKMTSWRFIDDGKHDIMLEVEDKAENSSMDKITLPTTDQIDQWYKEDAEKMNANLMFAVGYKMALQRMRDHFNNMEA